MTEPAPQKKKMSLLDRISQGIKGNQSEQVNTSAMKPMYRETKPLPQTQPNIPPVATPPTAHHHLSPSSSDVNISRLTSVLVAPERLNNPEISQGNVGELYTLYRQCEQIGVKFNEEQSKISNEIAIKRNELSEIDVKVKNDFKERENQQRRELEETVARLKQTVVDKTRTISQQLRDNIDALKQEYEDDYNKQLQDVDMYSATVTKIVDEFEIPRRRITIPDSLNLEDMSSEELYNLVIENAEVINKLEDITINFDSSVDLDRIFEGRNSMLKSAGLISLSTVLSPITFSIGIFNIGKKMLMTKRIKELVKEVEDEILLCERILLKKQRQVRESYEKPDVSELEDELLNIEDKVGEEFAKQIVDAERALNKFMKDAPQRNKNIMNEIEQVATKKIDEIASLESKLKDVKARMEMQHSEACKLYNSKSEEFMRSQITPNFYDTSLTDKLSKLESTVSNIRVIKEYNLLKSLSYNTVIPPDLDDPDEIARREYDALLLQRVDKLKVEVDKLNEQQLTLDVLNQRKDKLDREIDSYYKLSTTGLHQGNAYITPEVKDLLNLEESSVSAFDNRSIMFIYNGGEEENYLVNYVKYITQQILASYHPDSVVVNIISKTRSSKFNNLQVSLDKFNDKTKKLEKGDPYCTAYSDPKEVEEIYEDQLQQISRYNSSDLIDKNFDELVLHRRKIGAIVPKYQINILHRESLSLEILKMSEESSDNGLINFYIVPQSEIYVLDKDGKVNVNKAAIEVLDNFSLVAEVKYVRNQMMLYLTDYKNNRINRLTYNGRTKEQIVEVSKALRERVFKIKGIRTFTLVKEFIDEQTGGNYWKKSAHKQLELYFGYVEGDKSQPYPIVMDENDSVHMFIGGTTGGGKSNVLGVVVNSLKMMYPPSELDMYYFDFKVVEVAIHTKPYKMPHCSAMTGTSSSEYLISLLRFIFNEMQNRYDLMDKWGVQKLSELQTKMRAKAQELRQAGHIEEADKLIENMPRRTVVIVDEVAQGFKHPDADVVSVIKDILTKLGELARAAGIHMILVSQEPGKIPQTLFDLCKLRGCTKAQTAVSKAVLGNGLCGRLENQFIGFFGTNDGGGDERANRRYVVPLNTNEESKILCKIAYQMSEDDINRNAVVFNDKDPYTYTSLKRYLNEMNVQIDELLSSDVARQNAKTVLHGNNFYVGEEAYFSPKFKPLELSLQKTDMENLAIATTNYNEVRNHFNLLYKQLAPYAVCVPIYCKNIPDFAPVEMFYKNNPDNKLFCPMFAKNILDETNIYRLVEEPALDEQGNPTVDAEGNPVKVLVDEQIYPYNAYQVVKGDIYSQPLDKNDTIKMDYYTKDLERYLATVIRLRKSNPEQFAQYPIYLIAFDFSGHSSIVLNTFPWKSIMSLINDANTCGVHLIAFTSTIGPLDSRNIFSKIIAGRLMADEQYRDYKGIPEGFCKYIDKRNSSNNRTYKVAQSTI